MSDSQPPFLARLSGAFAISSALFFPVLLWIGISGAVQQRQLDTLNHTLVWAVNSLDAITFSVALILVVIFVIAYPVERWLIRPSQSEWRAASTYVLVFSMTLLLSILWIFVGPVILRQTVTDFTGIIVAYASVAAGIVAFFARVLYPSIVKFKKTNLTISALLIALAIAGAATPTITANAAVGEGFYPKTLTGEIARGTYEINEADGSGGTQSNNGTFVPNGEAYDDGIYFACSEPASQKYQIIVRTADYAKTFADFTVVCKTTNPVYSKINLGSEQVEVNVLVAGVANSEKDFVGTVNGKSTHPDAYAVLVAGVTY
jgi:hypothetical protein